MGTDIHIVIEQRWGDKWVGVKADRSVAHGSYAEDVAGWTSPAIGRRDYAFFGRLANVRTPGPEPLGLPPDASDLTRMLVAEMRGDGHSHSYLSLHDFAMLWCAEDAEFVARLTTERLRGEEGLYTRLMSRASVGSYDTDDKPDEFRVVFWFDN